MLPTVSGLKIEVPSKLWDSTPAYMTSQQNLSQTQPRLKRNLSLADNLNGPGDPRPGLLLAWPG